jgi:hypothetical protein
MLDVRNARGGICREHLDACVKEAQRRSLARSTLQTRLVGLKAAVELDPAAPQAIGHSAVGFGLARWRAGLQKAEVAESLAIEEGGIEAPFRERVRILSKCSVVGVLSQRHPRRAFDGSLQLPVAQLALRLLRRTHRVRLGVEHSSLTEIDRDPRAHTIVGRAILELPVAVVLHEG